MSEREKIVAWLRREADEYQGAEYSEWCVLIARSIESGEHLIRPEPTIPASEWMPKSNLTY